MRAPRGSLPMGRGRRRPASQPGAPSSPDAHRVYQRLLWVPECPKGHRQTLKTHLGGQALPRILFATLIDLPYGSTLWGVSWWGRKIVRKAALAWAEAPLRRGGLRPGRDDAAPVTPRRRRRRFLRDSPAMGSFPVWRQRHDGTVHPARRGGLRKEPGWALQQMAVQAEEAKVVRGTKARARSAARPGHGSTRFFRGARVQKTAPRGAQNAGPVF